MSKAITASFALEEMNGVIGVDADPDTQKITVNYDDEKISVKEMKIKIAKIKKQIEDEEKEINKKLEKEDRINKK